MESGFPRYKSQLPEHLRVFWKYRGELAVERRLIVLNTYRFFVPEAMREEILRKARQGENRLFWYMQQFYFWPSLCVDCKHFVKSCVFCQDNLPAVKKQPERSLPELSFPMEELHLDAGVEDGQHFVGVYCRFSQLQFILQLADLRCV